MTNTNITRFIAEGFINKHGGVYLDANNILWKMIDGKFIGKRSVFTIDFRACWIEDTPISNVKDWLCGKNADYNEIFYIKKDILIKN